jgi:outer membrane autotransporter protein
MRPMLLSTALLLAIAAPAHAQSVGDVLGQFADTGPTRETARAIATLCPAGNRLTARLQTDCNTLVGAAFQNNAQVRNALVAITADNATVPIDRSGLGRTQISSPLALTSLPSWALAAREDDGLLSLALSGSDGDSPWSAYLQARFDTDERSNTGNEDGFDRDGRTLTLGVDRRIGASGYLGAALAFGQSELDYGRNSGELDTDERAFNLYAGWQAENGFHLDSLLSITRRDQEQLRLIAYGLDNSNANTANQRFSSAFDSDERLLALTAGFRFNRDNWTLDPYLRLESVDASSDGYAERPSNADGNGGGWGVQVAELDETFTRTVIGLHSAWAISAANGVYVPYVDLSWVKVSGLDAEAARLRYTGDRSSTVGLSEVEFFMAADAEDDSYGSLGLGLSAQWANGWSGFLGYRQNIAEDRYEQRRVDLGLRMAF